jgi:hypothetical protein
MGAFLIFAPRSALYHICGSSSAGRASPCQGEGRGFESRLPLLNHPYADGFFFNTPCPGGGTGRHAGLKILFAEKASAGSIPAPGTKNPAFGWVFYCGNVTMRNRRNNQFLITTFTGAVNTSL